MALEQVHTVLDVREMFIKCLQDSSEAWLAVRFTESVTISGIRQCTRAVAAAAAAALIEQCTRYQQEPATAAAHRVRVEFDDGTPSLVLRGAHCSVGSVEWIHLLHSTRVETYYFPARQTHRQ